MIYLYIMVMALVTYLIRLLPLTLFREKIENRFVKSFLYYVPYACLMAMTFPAVFSATESLISAAAAVAVALLLAMKEKGLVTVAVSASVTALVVSYLVELL